MSNFSFDDRRRSIRRYFAMGFDGLESTYDWTTQREEISDEARPAALVEPATVVVRLSKPSTQPEPVNGTSRGVHQGQTYAVVLYPDVSANEEPRVSRKRADDHAQRLDDIVTLGLVDATTKASIAMPDCIPAWDFSSVPVAGAGRSTRPDNPYGWMLVDDWQVHPLQDPLDERRWSVAAQIRLSWWKGGRLEPPGETTGKMPVGWTGTTP